MHAGVEIKSHQREKFEKLIRYIARGPLSNNRLMELPNGQLVYNLKSKWSDGTTHVIFTPIEFIEKLVALIPPPRANLVRYHGVFALDSRVRALVTQQFNAWTTPRTGGTAAHEFTSCRDPVLA